MSVFGLAPDATPRETARRIAQLAKFSPPESKLTIGLLHQFVCVVTWVVDGQPYQIDSSGVSEPVAETLGLDYTEAELAQVSADLGVERVARALPEFTAVQVARQLAGAGLVVLVPPVSRDELPSWQQT